MHLVHIVVRFQVHAERFWSNNGIESQVRPSNEDNFAAGLFRTFSQSYQELRPLWALFQTIEY